MSNHISVLRRSVGSREREKGRKKEKEKKNKEKKKVRGKLEEKKKRIMTEMIINTNIFLS